jgi:hypothetical protein
MLAVVEHQSRLSRKTYHFLQHVINKGLGFMMIQSCHFFFDFLLFPNVILQEACMIANDLTIWLSKGKCFKLDI